MCELQVAYDEHRQPASEDCAGWSGGGRKERRVECSEGSSEEASAIPAGEPEGHGECSAEGRVEMRVP